MVLVDEKRGGEEGRREEEKVQRGCAAVYYIASVDLGTRVIVVKV